MNMRPKVTSKSQTRVKKSLYDIKPQVVRTGIAGWKLTKRPLNQVVEPIISKTSVPTKKRKTKSKLRKTGAESVDPEKQELITNIKVALDEQDEDNH